MAKVEKFALGIDVMPKWCHEQIRAGRVRIKYDEGTMIGATVFTPTKTMEVRIGDYIAYSKHGLSVLPREEIKKERKIEANEKAV